MSLRNRINPSTSWFWAGYRMPVLPFQAEQYTPRPYSDGSVQEAPTLSLLMFQKFRGNVLNDIANDNAQQQDLQMNDLIAVKKLAEWDKLKALVLDSVSSPITRRVYNMALNEFMDWFQQAPRPGFTKATVSAWRVSLEARGLGSSSIIIRLSAIRKLAAAAAEHGLLASGLPAR